MALTSNFWATLDRFRGSAETMFVRDVLPHPDQLADYDQIVAAGRAALEARGIDLDIEEQKYIVASTICWMANFVAGLTVSKCGDQHVLFHTQEGLKWPAFLVRELTLDVPADNQEATDEA
jgi:hypothetical protein